jgi:gamma-glutamyltranspeptidase/glutathione hydrolase
MHHYQGPGRSVAFSAKGMCSTSHPLAAMTALDIMRQGGNAVDAAVAGAVVLGLCEPMMCGLGGDVFAMLSLPGRNGIVGLNGSGHAPAALGAGLLREQGHGCMPLASVNAITLPGAVEAFDRLVRDWGRLELGEVLGPAIRVAEEGVPVCHRSARDWETFAGRLWGTGVSHYLDGGRPYRAGQRFASPAQAEALRLIARDGKDAFYRGAIMQDMLSTLNAAGGLHSAEDFAAVESDYVEPISVDYRGFTLTELPPNGQGVTALLLAKILERFDIGKMDPNGARRIHLEAEATRLAYDARDRFVGDPVSSMLRLDHMLSDSTADALAALIDPDHAQPTIRERAEAVHRDTVCICVVDEDRCAVSLIYSIFWPFGSGLASERYGISFQNRGAGFSLTEGHVNELKGGKRPLHTLIPGFAERRGEYLMPFGVMGGAYQATGHAHLLSNLADFEMDIQAAIDAPRSFADPVTGKLMLEIGFGDDVAASLSKMGHEVERAKIGMGGAQAIQIDIKRGILVGGTDPRKDGVALGY